MDIFDEVAEDLRHERAVALARRYGIWLLAACIAVLLGVGAQQGWQSWQASRAQKAAAQFLEITGPADTGDTPPDPADAEKTAGALEKFASAAPEGYKTLARLRAAALYADAGKPDKAEALWTAVARDGDADKLLRDAATLLWAEHAIGTKPDGEILARLRPLAFEANPYHALAREAQGLVYLHQGNIAEAKALFTQITTDPTAPINLRSRAQALVDSLNG